MFKRTYRPALALLIAVPLLFASAGAPLAQNEAPELKSVRIARTYGWHPVGAEKLVVWLGVEEPYMLAIEPGCVDLAREPATGLTSHRRRLQPRLDHVVTASARCPIQSLRRATATEIKASGLKQSTAQPLPLIPVKETTKSR